MALAIPVAFIGTQVSGDIGGYTLYTDRKLRNVAYPRHPPKKPRSILQARQRSRFAFIQSAFADEPQDIQEAWERASLTMSLQMTGRNLYTALAFRQDEPLRQTLERQSGESLPMPPDPEKACP
jgi:hypothetical protein